MLVRLCCVSPGCRLFTPVAQPFWATGEKSIDFVLLPQGWAASHSTELGSHCFCQWDNAWLPSQDKTLQPTDPGLFPTRLHFWVFGFTSADFTEKLCVSTSLSTTGILTRRDSRGYSQQDCSWQQVRSAPEGALEVCLAEPSDLPRTCSSAALPNFWWCSPYLLPGFSWLQTVALIPSYVSWNCKDKFCSLVFVHTLKISVILP